MLSQKPTKEGFTVSDLSEQPTDTVSSISWSKAATSSTFATGSWDSHVRIYQIDTEESSLRQTISFDAQAPCLGVDWHEDGTQVFAGCASGGVKGFDLGNSKGFDIGSHSGPVKSAHWMAEVNLLCSVSFDKTIKLWDLRQSSPVYQFELRYKPRCSDAYRFGLALALSECRVAVIDLVEALKTQSSQEGLQYMESPLGDRDPLSSIKFLTNGDTLAFGTVGGRCNISWLEKEDPQTIKLKNVMIFKAHKVEGDPNRPRNSQRPDVMYPINSLLVNSKNPLNFVGTCGGEGKIYHWDFQAKNKICEFRMKDPVTCGKMSGDGNYLAFATGNDWSRGISEHMTKRSEIHILCIQDKQLVYDRDMSF